MAGGRYPDWDGLLELRTEQREARDIGVTGASEDMGIRGTDDTEAKLWGGIDLSTTEEDEPKARLDTELEGRDVAEPKGREDVPKGSDDADPKDRDVEGDPTDNGEAKEKADAGKLEANEEEVTKERCCVRAELEGTTSAAVGTAEEYTEDVWATLEVDTLKLAKFKIDDCIL